MATEELKVKFKVDTGEVKSGADEAKNKVKQATSQMASDTKQASASMSSSMKDVQRATDGVAGATKTATTAVKQMEGQVSQSAQKMSADLGKVAEQVKGISTVQMAHIGGRALGLIGRGMKTAGDLMPEDWETGKTVMNIGGAALSGAATGLTTGAAVGGAIGSIIPGAGTAAGAAIGSAIGAAGGALLGAATELLSSAKAQREAAEELRKNAQKSLAEHGRDLDDRERFAKYDKENQILLSGIGKTWWENKSTGEKITGEQRVYQVQEARQAALDKATKERDEFVREHRYDTGDAAKEAAQKLYYLDEAVNKAAQHLQALAPVVEAAKKSEADKVKEQQKQQEAYARASAALDEKIAKVVEQGRKADISDTKDSIREHQHTMSSLQSQLQGVISSPLGGIRSDSLTRMGGGRGYAAYNNGAANIQSKIESNLRRLISVEETQLNELNNKLENLTQVVQNKNGAAWLP